MDNFKELISEKQIDMPHQNLIKTYSNKKLVTMELCGEGSFLANSEIPPKYREKILNMFSKYSDKEQVNMQVILETKVSDFLENYKEFENKKDLITKLNLTLLFGFESVDDFTRQVVYNKGLKLSDFESAVRKGQEMGFKIGTFLFCGFHSMTQKEIVEDIKKTIDYCRNKEIAIYLMLPNLQKFTLNHLLLKYGKYNFPELRTILEIIKYLVNVRKENEPSFYFNGYDWSIGGLTTYPEPELFLFSNGNKITCKKCSHKIKDVIHKLAKTYNLKQFDKSIKELENCQCKEEYERFINSETNINIRTRVEQNLDFADKLKEEYTKEELK